MPMNVTRIKIAPSILSADFSRLGEQVREAEAGGANYIHVDVMDGHFVTNLTLGPLVVAAIRPHTFLPLDVHLMIEAPERFIEAFARAGADILTVHQEACTHLHRVVQAIKELGLRAGVALNPATPLTSLDEILPDLDLVLIMSVNPGFGGQRFLPRATEKLRGLKGMIEEKATRCEIEVDGGINPTTAPEVIRAGAEVLVAGSAIFNQAASPADNITTLRKSCLEAASAPM